MADLNGGDKLVKVTQQDVNTGSCLQQLYSGLNRVAKVLNVSASGTTSPPPPPTGMNVSVGSDGIHYSIEHPGSVNRGVQYFSEIATDSAFNNVVAIRDHGASRTDAPVSLPAKTSAGVQHTFYLRSYAQYHGSAPSNVYVHPGAITLSGSSQMDFAPNTGSGTASNGGGQNAYGLGRFATRQN